VFGPLPTDEVVGNRWRNY